MKTFFINPATNDIELDGRNRIKMVDGDEALIQKVSISLRINQGEWFLNPETGFDRSTVQTKEINYEAITNALTEAVLRVEGVGSVEDISFDFDRPQRKLKIYFAFTKEDGTLLEGEAVA